MTSDPQVYERLVMSYNEEVEQVLIDSQKRILNELSIDNDVFEDSILQLMERGLY